MRNQSARPAIRTPLKSRLNSLPFAFPHSSHSTIHKTSLWKDEFKKQCLVRARKKRQEMLQARRNATHSKPQQSQTQMLYSTFKDEHMTAMEEDHPYSYLTPPPPSCRSSLEKSQTNPYKNFSVHSKNNNHLETDCQKSNLSATAKELVQDELRANLISVSRPVLDENLQDSISPATFISGAADVAASVESVLPFLQQNNPTTVNPYFSTSNPKTYFDSEPSESMNEFNCNQKYMMNEDELYQLMQEVEEELQKEEDSIAKEIDEMESEYMQEKLLLEEQIADFEMWQQQQQQGQL